MAKHSRFTNCSVLIFLALALVVPALVGAADTGKSDTALKDVSSQQKVSAEEKPNPYKDADISIKIIPSSNKTYGYDIILYGKPLVHQPSIPGLLGNEGFTTKERAQKVAEFVVNKIRNNEMPPKVSMEDLNSMGVLK